MILLTGATGYIGRHVLRRLRAGGSAVRALVLPDDRTELAEQPGLEVVRGDILHPDSLLPHGSGVSALVHAAALMLPNPAGAIQRANVDGTRNLLELAGRWKVRRFVYFSAVSAVYRQLNVYGRSKAEAEAMVRASGLDYTILRPTMVYGPGGGLHFAKLVALIDKLPLVTPILGSGRARLQPVHVDDVAAAVDLVLREPKAAGKTYNVAGASVVTFDGLVDAILAARGRRRVKLHLPLPVCLAAAYVLAPLLGPRSFLNREALRGVNQDADLDYGPFASDCGFAPQSLEKGLAAVLGPSSDKR